MNKKIPAFKKQSTMHIVIMINALHSETIDSVCVCVCGGSLHSTITFNIIIIVLVKVKSKHITQHNVSKAFPIITFTYRTTIISTFM